MGTTIDKVKQTKPSSNVKTINKNKSKNVTVPVGAKTTTHTVTTLITPNFSQKTTLAIIDAQETLGLNKYNLSLYKDSYSMLQKSQTNLIDLIKYYEGDPNYYYEGFTSVYSDTFGKKTTGFGHYFPKKTIKTQEEAYETLTQDLKEANKNIKNIIGEKTYKALPLSIKEALIDLAFNKGANKIKENSKLVNAIKNKDYSKIVANMYYLTSGSNSNNNTQKEPGLYKRSLSRMILAIRDLSGKELEEAKQEIEKFYKEGHKFYTDNGKNNELPDYENVYNAFKKNPITTKTKYADNYKIKVEQGKTAYSTANDAYKALNDTSVSMSEYRKAFYKLNNIDENNPPEIKAGEELLAPPIKNIKAILGGTVQQPEKTVTQEKETTKNNPSALIQNKPEAKEKTDSAELAEVVETPDEDSSDSSDNSWWKTALSGATGGLLGLFAGKLIKTKKPALIMLGLLGIGIGFGLHKLINYFKNKNQEEDSDPKTGFQKMLADPNTEITTNGEFEILTLNYKIKKGDTIYTLSRNYAVKQNVLCNNNDIENPNLINEGQNLKVHKLGYKVKKGDSIESIAQNFGLNSGVIEEINGITEETKINQGQILEIPGYIYIVKSGDTLTAISKQVGVSIDKLKEINKLSSDLIHPNQKIIVLFNDTDYDISPDKKNVTVDKETNARIETIDLSNNNEIGNRKYLKKRKINGKNAASREVLEPTGKGKLNGKTIIINAGHGFQPSGITDNDLDIGNPSSYKDLPHEYLLNYDNAFRLIERLRKQGAKVIYIQGYEGKATKGWNLVSQELKRKGNNADMFISVHANFNNPAPKKDRAEFLYHKDAPDIKGKNLALIMERKFDKYQKDEKYSKSEKRDLSVLRTTNSKNIPSVLWEVGFMNHPDGHKRLTDSSLMDKYADMMCESIIEYFDKYKK